MNNTTDTNQASEDELQRYHLSGCAKYETLRGIYPNDRRLTGDPCSCGIEALIRTEKLKLLDEAIHQSTVNLKSAKAVAGWAELRKKQLEAEL